MSAIPCPQCGRRLKLGDDLRGQLVQCPLCGTAFEAPREEPSPPWRPPAPASGVPPLPGRRLEAGDFARPAGGATPGAQAQAALQSAALWLKVTLFLQGVSGFCCCSLPMGANPDFHIGLIAAMIVGKYIPLVFAGLAANRLRLHSGYRLAFTGGILVLLASVWTLLEMAFMALAAAAPLDRHRSFGGEFGLLGCIIALGGALCGFVGGMKTLSVLSDPAVRRAFR
jgi:hypothetical protein